MPSPNPFLTRRGDTALIRPQSPRQSNHNNHCTGTCAIVLAIVIPVLLLAFAIILVFIVGKNSYLGRRRQRKAEHEAAKTKLGDEDSVGSSDVNDVPPLNEGRRTEAREKSVEGEQKGVKREEGHEHDHVLAMIVARP